MNPTPPTNKVDELCRASTQRSQARRTNTRPKRDPVATGMILLTAAITIFTLYLFIGVR